MDSHTPAMPRTPHTMVTATMVTMPSATESRNAAFITDQGSIRVSRRRARRGRRPPEDLAATSAAFFESGLALARIWSFAAAKAPLIFAPTLGSDDAEPAPARVAGRSRVFGSSESIG